MQPGRMHTLSEAPKLLPVSESPLYLPEPGAQEAVMREQVMSPRPPET